MDHPIDQAFTPFPVLTTARLILRRLSTEDAPDVFAIFADPLVTRYYDVTTMLDPQEAFDLVVWWLNRIDERKALRWGVTYVGGGNRLVGTVGFSELDKDNHLGEIGIDLAPQCWNQGVATEAGSAIIDFGFRVMQLNRIETWVSTGNIGSIRTLKKMGFVSEGLLRKRRFWQDSYQDVEMFAMLRQEYLERGSND